MSSPSGPAKGGSISKLPQELLTEVVSHCDLVTKARLCLASRLANKVATPHLYSDVDLNVAQTNEKKYKGCLKTIKKASKNTLAKRLAVWVHPPRHEGTLYFGYDPDEAFVERVSEPFVGVLKHLPNLKHFGYASNEYAGSSDLHIAASKVPSLESIQVLAGPRPLADKRYDYREGSYPNLRRAVIHKLEDGTVGVVAKFRIACPKLVSMRLAPSEPYMNGWLTTPAEIECLWNALFPGSLPNPKLEKTLGKRVMEKATIVPLEEIELDAFPFPYTNYPATQPYADAFKSLKKLQFIGCMQRNGDVEFFKQFQYCFPKLTELNLAGTRPSVNGHGLAHLLKQAPPIKKLTLYLWELNVPEMVSAICCVGKTLEFLVLEGDYMNGSPVVSELSVETAIKLGEGCPNLKELSICANVTKECWFEIAAVFASRLKKLQAVRMVGVDVKEWDSTKNHHCPINVVLDTGFGETDYDDFLHLPGPTLKRSILQPRQEAQRSTIQKTIQIFQAVGNMGLKYVGINAIVARVWIEREEIIKLGLREVNEMTTPCKDLVGVNCWIFDAFRKIYIMER